jgi:glycosyltransferase involved in cell wall biosynthesis
MTQGHTSHVFTFGHTRTRDTQPNIWRSPGLPIGTTQLRFGLAMTGPARCAARHIDVIHTHEPFIAGRIAAREARGQNKPLIFTNHTRHDLYILNYPRIVRPFMRRQAFGRIARFVHASTLATAPSEETAAWLRRLAPDAAERVRVVRNGIRLDPFDHPAHPEPGTRAELGIDADATLFVYVGRLTPEKNLPAFADALVRAVNAGANAHWLVIGDGEFRKVLQARLAPIHERVHFLGAVPREQVPRYLAAADVFATPSLSEVNPVSVIEGLASGRPYIGLRAVWWDEFEGEARSLPPPGFLADNEAELGHAIAALCRDRTVLTGMSAAARQLSRRFDIRAITAQWIDLYRGAIIGA